MASIVYDSYRRDIQNGALTPLTDTVKVELVTSAYVPNQATHAKRSDLSNEISGVGYSAGGQALANKAVTLDTTNHRGIFSADNLLWPNSTITARGCVVYKSRGGAATADELMYYLDFGGDVTSTSATFTIAWSSSGIGYIG